MSRISFLLLLLFPQFIFAQVDPNSITIYRDAYGTPHVYAPTDAAAAYGLAWAHAEDNFFDIQENLMIARARLGEVRGAWGASIDFAVQLLRVRPVVEERYDSDVPADFKAVLEAFCLAMNTYADRHPEEIRLKGLFPVYPQDVLIGYQMIMGLMAGVDGHLTNIVEGTPNAPTAFSMDGRGSNAWAFNSSRTADGQVYLVNNSHQPLEGSTAWYEAHVVSDEGWNCLGGMFPGGVSIFSGCNPYLAWAHTVNLGDFVDVYRLEMHPKKKGMYRLDGEWKQLKKYKAKMKVKVGPIKLKVGKKYWWSDYGATMKGKDGHYYSIRLACNMGIKAAEQWYRMNKAQSFSEFYGLLNMGGISSLNIIYADRNDTIFYIDNGNYPFRERGYDWWRVLPGDTSATLWDDFHSTEELVQVIQPRSGYVYNCNNTPFSSTGFMDLPQRDDYDPTLGTTPSETNRSLRSQELITGDKLLSYEDIKRIKYDRTYPQKMATPFMSNTELLMELDSLEFPDLAEEIRMLAEWDRTGNEDSEAAGLFLVYLDKIIKEADKRHEMFLEREWLPEEAAEQLRNAKVHLETHFGTNRVPLGQIQRLVHGEYDFPLGGLQDVLASMRSQDWENGRYKGLLGDSYIQFVKFSEQGVQLESVLPFGSSNHADSPHYVDQSELYLGQKTKEISLDRKWVEENAVRSYHPGE